MSTPVVYSIAIVLYLLSCVRAWHRITRPPKSELKNLSSANPIPSRSPHLTQPRADVVDATFVGPLAKSSLRK